MKSMWKMFENAVIDNCILQFHPGMGKLNWWVGTRHKQQTRKKLIIINQDLKVLKQLTGSLLTSPNTCLPFGSLLLRGSLGFFIKRKSIEKARASVKLATWRSFSIRDCTYYTQMLQQTFVAETAYLSCNLSLSTKRQFPHSVLQTFLKALMTILLILFPPFLRRN